MNIINVLTSFNLAMDELACTETKKAKSKKKKKKNKRKGDVKRNANYIQPITININIDGGYGYNTPSRTRSVYRQTHNMYGDYPAVACQFMRG